MRRAWDDTWDEQAEDEQEWQQLNTNVAPADTQLLAGTACSPPSVGTGTGGTPQIVQTPPPHIASESEAPAHAEPDTEPEASPQKTLLEAPPQIPNQFQPLAEVEDEDNDYVGLENRAAVGEQSDEEETAQAGGLHQVASRQGLGNEFGG